MNTARTFAESRSDSTDSTHEPRHWPGHGLFACNRWSQVCMVLALANWMNSVGSLAQAVPTGALLTNQAKPAEASRFGGRWDLTVKDSSGKEMPSWLEIVFADGSCQAHFVGRWGNSRPVPKIEINRAYVRFISPKAEEDSKTDLVFEGHLVGDTITGTAQGPNGAPWKWSARRAPVLLAPANIQWDEPVSLFNGTNFDGWTYDNPKRAESWTVKDGCLVNNSAGANLVTTGKYQNFKLHVEFNCPVNANSGVYLRGRYEVQVEDDSIQEPPSHHMGAVYGFLAPQPEQPRHPGIWQSFDIAFVGRQVTVWQNGHLIIDHEEIPGITGGALDSQEEIPGPIYLQGDHGGIAYRNLILTPAKP